MKYNIQVKEDAKDWESIKPKSVEFDTRAEAVESCKQLAKFHQKVIRMTEGNSMNGNYFRP